MNSKQLEEQHVQNQSQNGHQNYDEIKYCVIQLNKLDSKELKHLEDAYPGLKIHLSYPNESSHNSSNHDLYYVDDDDDDDDHNLTVSSKKKSSRSKTIDIFNSLDFILK